MAALGAIRFRWTARRSVPEAWWERRSVDGCDAMKRYRWGRPQKRGLLLPGNFGKPVSIFVDPLARNAMRFRAAGAATSRAAGAWIGRGDSSREIACTRARARASAGVFGGSEAVGDGIKEGGDGTGGTSGAAAAARGW